MTNYDAGALYDEVKSGRLKLDQLSDAGLNALKGYVYTKNLKSFPAEPTYYTKATEDALANKQSNVMNSTQQMSKVENAIPKQNSMLNYSTTQPAAANATQNALSQMYKDYQKGLADSTIYSGSAPKQANVGKIEMPTQKEIENRLFQSKVNEAIRKAQQIESDPNIASKNLLGTFGDRLAANIQATGGAGNFGGSVKGQMLQYLPQEVAAQIEKDRLNLGNPIANTATDLLGQTIGLFTPIGAEKSAATLMNEVTKYASKLPYADNVIGKASNALFGAGANVASKVASKLPQRIQPAALNAMKEAAKQVPAGAYLGGVDIPIRKDINPIDNPKEYAQSVLENTVLASGLGAGASLVGSAIKGTKNAVANRVNSELAQIADQVLKKYKFDVGQQRYQNLGGAEQAAKSATGNINMQRYKNSILSDEQIQAIKRNNADFALREIADQQTKYIQRQTVLNKSFEDLPEWQKQQALEQYLERTKNDPQIRDFTSEKVREQRINDVEMALGRLSELDRTFESLPTEVQMALKDYEDKIKTRGQSMDMRQRELNAALGEQANKDQLLKMYEELFKDVPTEKEARNQELKSNAVPISQFSAENVRNQRQKDLEATLSPIAIAEQNRLQKQQELKDAFDNLPQFEQERLMRDYMERTKDQPKITDFTSEKMREQRQKSLDETFSSLMKKEEKQNLYEDLFAGFTDPNKKKQLNELDTAISDVQEQIRALDTERKANIQAETDRLWNDYTSRKKTTIDPMMKTIETNGFIRVPSKNSFYFEEYKNLPAGVKRKYFRYSDTAMQIDEMSDALGITANDLLSNLREETNLRNIGIEDLWLQEYRKNYGYEVTKDRLSSYVNDLFERGNKSFPTPIDEFTGYRENKDALESVLEQMKSDRNDMIQTEYKNKMSIDQASRENKKATQKVIKGQEMSSGFLPFNRVQSGFKMSDIRSADPTVETSLTATKTFRKTVMENIKSKLLAPVEFTKNIYKSYFQYRYLLKDMPKLQNTFRLAEGMPQDARDFAKNELDSIVGSLRDKPEFEIFKRVIMLRDFEQEVLAGRKVPGDLSLNQIQNELKQLNNKVNMSNSLKTAIDNHDRLMQSIADDLVARGKLDEKSVKTSYYPHRVLDYTKTIDQAYGTGSNELKAPYRFYTKQRGGSKKLIESDYISVMNNMLYKVKMDNQIDDFVAKILSENNKIAELNNQIAEPMLHKDGISVEFNDANTYTFWDYNGKHYLIDDRIYQNLKDFKGKSQLSPLLSAGQQFTSWWKRVTLDFAGLTFHYTNFLGDMLALYRDDPVAFKNLPKALEMLTKSDSKLSRVEQNILGLAKKQRIFQSGITEGILGEMFPKRPVNTKFTPAMTKFAYYLNPFNVLENVSNIRESIPRLAKFLTDVERIQKGQSVKSNIIDVEKLKSQGLKDIDIAGKVTREGFIDYGFLSKHAQAELRGLIFPFFTFYYQNLKNWSKYVAKHPVNYAAKFGVPFGATMLWNNTGDRKAIEEKLPDYIRDVPHIITGYKDENGKDYVITFSTPMSAAENVVALNQLPRRIIDVIDGKTNFDDALMEQAKSTLMAPIKTVVGLTGPLFKAPVEVIANKNAFTGGQIVPDRLPESEALKEKAKYLASQFFTPIGTVQRFQNQELSPEGTILNGIANQFTDVKRMFGKYVDLSRVERNNTYERADQALEGQKDSKFNVENAYVDYALGNMTKEQFISNAKDSGLTQQQVINIAKSPRVQIKIINENLKKESDQNKRRLLIEQKNRLLDLMEKQRIETLPKSARKEVMEGR